MELGPASPTSGSAPLLPVGPSDAEERNTGLLYEDKHVRLTQNTVTIKWYYFPIGSARMIPLRSIRKVTLLPLPPWWKQQWKHWGMGIDIKHWWPCDSFRATKTNYVEIDAGDWPVPAVTAEDASKLYSALSQALIALREGGMAHSAGQAGAVDVQK